MLSNNVLVVDRIEGNLAVVEKDLGSFENVPLSKIAGRVRDGVVLGRRSDGSLFVDEAATKRRTNEMQARARSLFK